MPRTYGGDAAEDIQFRMGLLAPALPGLSSGPVTTGPTRAPAGGIPGTGSTGSIAGTPLGTAGPAPAASGGGGGILGMTGSQAALAAMSGVASFMGGYQRNPGLLQISSNMSRALAYDIQQQRQAAIAAQIAQDRDRILQNTDPSDPKSLEKAGMEFYRFGQKDMGDAMLRRSETLVDDARALIKQSFDIENTIRKQANQELASNEIAMSSARSAQAVVISEGGVNNMSRAGDEALMTLWAKVLRPREALMGDDRRTMQAAGLSGTFQQMLGWLNDQGKLTPEQRQMIMRNIQTLAQVHAEDYQRKGGDLERMAKKYGSTAGSTTRAPKPDPAFDPLQGQKLRVPSVAGATKGLLRRSVESTLGVSGSRP